MKTKLLSLLVVLVVGVGTAFATSCPATTYDNYVGPPSLSCTITDKTFSNFFYSTAGSDHMPDSQITVTPIANIGSPALLFNAAWNVGSLHTQDSLLGFTVNVNPGSSLITDLSLAMFGAGFTGTGSVSVSETYCLGDTFADGCKNGTTGTLFTYLNRTGSKLIDEVTFKGVSTVDVMKDVLLSGGDSGSAVLSGVENQFSEPEPSTLSVLGASLLIMGGLVRRRLGA